MGVNRYKGTCSSNAALVNKYVGTAYDHVKTVSDNIEDVKTVADALGDDFPDEGLDTLVNNIDDIVTNAENISDINTVAGIKDEVITVAGIEQEIIDVPSYTAQAIDAANAAEEDADRATEQADLAANIADPYKGLWPDVGGGADKGDVFQTQVGGVGTGQYFTALQNTTADPVSDDVNWRALVSFSSIIGENLISNASFEIAGSVINPPDATPRSYSAGDELFYGVFAVGALSGVTYTDGKINGIGQLYIDIAKTDKQKLSTSSYVASIADSDGIPVVSGVSFVNNGDSWRVTFDMDNVFTVKFESGVIATKHELTKGNAAEVVDLIVGVGQSNAQGQGDVYRSPDCPVGFNASLGRLQDPVGTANEGSLWPSFVNEHYLQTGRKSVAINVGAFGSGLIAESNPSSNWSPTGSLRQSAVDSVNSVRAIIDGSKNYRVGSIIFVWLQGENEGGNLNDTTITPELYKTALVELKDFFKGEFGQFSAFGVVMIGSLRGTGRAALNINGSDIIDFEKIRLAQSQIASSDPDMTLLYSGSISFGPRYLMSDNIHYDQVGLNEVGRCAAIGLANEQPVSNISPFLGGELAVSPTSSGNTELIVNRNLSVFTNTLIVCASSATFNSNANVSLSVDVDGVPMREVSRGFDNATGRTSCGIFVINEADLGYGMSGRGVTVTLNSRIANFLSLSIIDARDIQYYQSIGFDNVADGSVVSETAANTDISTYMPSLIVGMASTIGDGAVNPTCTFSGLDLEFSGGVDNGSRNAAMFVGVSEQNTNLEASAISSTLSLPQTNIALMCASFRPLIKGETDNRYNV